MKKRFLVEEQRQGRAQQIDRVIIVFYIDSEKNMNHFGKIPLLFLLWSLVGALAENIDIDISFDYVCHYSSTLSVEVALGDVDLEAEDFLRQEVEANEVDVEIKNLTSVATAACAQVNPPPASKDVSECTVATGTVTVNLDSEIKYELVQRLTTKKLQRFLDQYNSGNTLTHVDYVSPVLVKVRVIFSFTGAPEEPLSAADFDAFVNSIKEVLGDKLRNGSPPLEIETIQLVGQRRSIPNRRRRLCMDENDELKGGSCKLELQDRNLNILEEFSNQLEVLVVSSCVEAAGENSCSETNVQEVVTTTSNDESTKEALLQALQDAPNSDYFDSVSGVVADSVGEGESLLNVQLNDNVIAAAENLPDVASTSDEANKERESNEEEYPVWLWGLIGGSVGIVVVGSIFAYMGVRRRNQAAMVRDAYDAHDQEGRKTPMSQEQPLEYYGNDSVTPSMGRESPATPSYDVGDAPPTPVSANAVPSHLAPADAVAALSFDDQEQGYEMSHDV